MSDNVKSKIANVNKMSDIYGNLVRKDYQKVILENAPIFPKPVEYADIDDCVFRFVEDAIDITIDGKKSPTYTLYSNQRFSEYSQMWNHTDENGNLYLNFKTINRANNPELGKSQGGLWNIPGRRDYTLLQREVLDDNGTESYELYTIKQPYAVDLMYNINFVTNTLENLNMFNQKINQLFAGRQYYVRPNGHYMPMVIENINDETEYSVSDRKFYVQMIQIRLMAYIIEPEDFNVKKYPKKIAVDVDTGGFNKKPTCVEVEEDNRKLKNRELKVTITFQPYNNKTEFVFDTDMVIENEDLNNIRRYRLMVNDTLYYTDKGFKLKAGDKVKVLIKQYDDNAEAVLRFKGYSETKFFEDGYIPEDVSETEVTSEEIRIE